MTNRTFVARARKLTPKQQHAFTKLWPLYGLQVEDGIIDYLQVFARDAPTILEIGFGTGQTLLSMAKDHPDYNFIGVEVYHTGVGALLAGLDVDNITNVRVYNADINFVLDQCIPDESLAKILIFFPDPWPKRRHHKRRLIQSEFINLLRKKMKLGADLHMATDWNDYAKHILQTMSRFPNFKNMAAANLYSVRPDFRPLTKFEKRGQILGHNIRDFWFVSC